MTVMPYFSSVDYSVTLWEASSASRRIICLRVVCLRPRPRAHSSRVAAACLVPPRPDAPRTMSRRSSIAGIPPQYTFVPQAPVPGPSSHHPTMDLTMLRTHAPNQPTASAHQPAPTYRSASLSMAGIPTHSAASSTYTYPYAPGAAIPTPSPGVSSPSPDVYRKQLDDYIVHRLNEVLKRQADAMSVQDARLAKCEEALKACITDARTETTQQNDRIAQQNEHMAQQNERANIILKALCDHAKGLDDKVDRLSKAIGVEVKEGEPATSLSSRVKDVEWTMGELLERIGDPLALGESYSLQREVWCPPASSFLGGYSRAYTHLILPRPKRPSTALCEYPPSPTSHPTRGRRRDQPCA